VSIGKPDHDWGKLRLSPKERRFLEGPESTLADLWNSVKIFGELFGGLRKMRGVGPCVTVFGSARFGEGNEYYQLAREVGSCIVNAGFAVMTGGGPGIMEAANRGAKDAGGLSVGCNIALPHEQKHNEYLDRWFTFDHFYIRKVLLVKYSTGFVACPGGFGTLDEVYETSTLIQTGKMKAFPVVFLGKEYWTPLFDFMHDRLVASRAIDEADLGHFLLTDSPEEAVEHILAVDRMALENE
jgi:uncharacterized protein (TIGR00730 family)